MYRTDSLRESTNMAEIHFEELLEERVILLTIEGDLSLEEWQATGKHIHERIVQGTPPVHLIIDTTSIQNTRWTQKPLSPQPHG